MSRSAHQRQQQKLQMQQQQLLAQQMADNEAAAAAAEMFDLFCVATTMRQILGLHRQMCDVVGLRPAPLNEFYPKLKTKVRSWKAQALWKKFDARAAHRAYGKGTACTGTRVLVIGAGPCGLRTAIEAQLLGAKVVVVEKRDRISRNNVLHLWPFVITDLRNLGAKKFYGKFCAGSIDHISIRQLQCILLKVALLLGVEIHEGVSFESTVEPSGDGCGWRASVTPADHAVSHYEFDVLIGADGKRNTLEAFKRKEFRGKLAIAITANFINKKTEAEAKAEEISGVAFIFNQSFFKELYHTTGIDLENIVYYKDETHYFVMTAKKHSLIDKGVILQDFADPAELLAPVNVNTEKLLDYAREAAEFSTKYQMPNLEFAVNHYGKPDVAMFDFTSMFAAESSCRVIIRKGFRLLQCLVGDSLLEPFWPTGSGCARGFLSSMDAAYALKLWSNSSNSTLGVVAQRESIYRLLGQTTPENLQRDIGSYTVDPATRYPNLNRTSVNVWQVKHLIDTDDVSVLEQTFMDTNALQATQVDTPVRRKRRSGDTLPLSTVLLRWICAQLHAYEFVSELKEVSDVFTNGKVLCALINRYRPDLVDFNTIKDKSPIEQNDLAFKILDKDLHIPRIMNGKDSVQVKNLESKVWLNYLEQICEVFRGEIPHVKHPKIDFSDLREKYKTNYAHAQPDFSKLLQLSTKQKAKSPIQDLVDVSQVVQRRSVLDEEKLKRQRRIEHQFVGNAASAGNAAQTDTPRRAKKRRSAEKAANIEERQKRLQEIEQNRQDRQSKRRQQRYQQTQNFYKSLHMLQANNFLREADENTPFEDYSIFLYRQQAPEFNDRVKDLERKLLYPDRERSDIPSAVPRSVDEQFSDRIKSMEQRISSRNAYGNDKKPKDLMRAIGKIDSNDWNVREIEKKIEQSKKTEVHGPKGREKVPKWSREQFQARQNKMAKPTRQDSAEEKFKEIDQTLRNLDKQLKEGNVLEVGKVASIAGQFVKRDDTSEEKNPPTIVPKSSTKVALAFKKQAASEKCHFCKQTVYLMEKLQTENLVMHRGCLKCHHCHTNLRLGAYAFDRDDPNGRFYCTQHFRLPAKAIRPVVRKPGQRKSSQQQQQPNDEIAIAAAAAVDKATVPALITSESGDELKTPDKRGPVDNVAKLDLLERGQTPERIEFENTDAMSDGEPSEEHIIDEHEWSGRNFLPESNNDSESDLSSSDQSDSDSDSDMFEEANDSPLGAQTLQLASEWIGKQNYSDSDDSDDFYDSSEGMADDGKDDTEGEEFAKARELRREEVRLPPLPPNLPTDTETEVMSTTEVPSNNGEDANKNLVIKEKKLKNVNENLPLEEIPKERKDSALSNASDLSFKSVSSLTNGNKTTAPTKTDIEKLDQNSDRKFSADIDAISEKLYRLNNVVKMNKDLETIAKENLIRSDILKKLNMKEKWLAENKTDSKSIFQEKVENFLKPLTKLKDDFFTPKPKTTNEKNGEKNQTSSEDVSDPFKPRSKFNDLLTKPVHKTEQETLRNETLVPKSKFKTEAEKSAAILDLIKDLKNKENHIKMNPEVTLTGQSNSLGKQQSKTKTNSKEMEVANQTAGKSNILKSQSATSSPLAKAKSSTVAKNRNSGSEMELEGILNIVKKIDLSKSDANKDMGHMLYKVESKFSPKPNKKMVDKMKEIEAKSFSGTLDSIKSQIETPTISTQAIPAKVDLSKYFPHQKPEEKASNALNKNQKTLSEVDLTKYFPSSPVPQRKSAVVTVADKLKKSQTEKSLGVSDKSASAVAKSSTAPKRHAPLGSSNYSLKDNQLDGTVDIIKKKPAAKVVTTTAVANPGKKGNVKIVRKIVPKGTKTKKNFSLKKPVLSKNEDDRILDEILESGSEAQRSPSLEYQRLFQEEKSPSEDISDKIERILEETGIDFGVRKNTATSNANDKRKKLLKTTSTDEAELKRRSSACFESGVETTKENSDNLSGVQNILKRFESLSSVSSSDHAFKLRRMESTTSNLNKSRESLTSRDSDNYSDLEKTMEYLKTEWRSEATNFLQNKRNDFHHKKQAKENYDEPAEKRLFNELPVQYKESKISKFFGLKQKSPEKRKSPIKKKKSPEKKLQNSIAIKKPALYTSLEELALISVSKQTSPTITSNLTLSNTDITSKKNNLVENKPKEKLLEKQSTKSEITMEEKTANVRPLKEDIKNLPKTGCDKSLSNSRRGSQTSLQSRRCSNASLTEKLEVAAVDLEKLVTVNDLNTETIVKKSASKSDNYDTDSLCTSLSKSPSVAPITVQLRGSSEDESIEKLFSKFSDEMLVNVEFDSNDELIAITPRSPLKKEEDSDQDILERVQSLERDTDKESSLENFSVPISNKIPIKTISNNDFSFPNGPQSRQKSLSSSSDSTAPLAPQRIKKKLARLSPSSIPPSVQDLLLAAAAKNELTESVETHNIINYTKPLKFPRIIDEDDILLDESQTPYKYFTEHQPSALKIKEKHLKNSVEQSVLITKKSLNDGFQNINELTENVTEFTKILRPISQSKKSQSEEDIEKCSGSKNKTKKEIIDNNSLVSSSTGDSLKSVEEIMHPKLSRREPSLEWNMEMIPHSPMPPKRKVSTNTKTDLIQNTPKESLNKFQKPEANVVDEIKKTPTKKIEPNTQKGNSMEISIDSEVNLHNNVKTKEILLPTNAGSIYSTSVIDGEKNVNLREKSPTTSIKQLNNIDANTEAYQKRLIEEFELERRHALIERDKQYQVMDKPDLKQSSSKENSKSSSKKSTPLVTPCKQSPRDSRRSSIQSSATNRGGTPPMMKPLELPGTPLSQTSRRSSFAFIELLDSKPVIAPMPKKLDLPKIADVPEKPDNLNQPPAEDAKKRPWPKLQEEEDDDVQSESESSSPDEIELNSATEISTDSEFDQDEMIREAPKIFIDDTHLKKPTKVQIKSTIISPSMNQKYNNVSSIHQGKDGGTYLTKYQTQTQQPIMPQFKPLVQVDPSLLNTNRTPLQNPRPGDYLLNKTASTEGIASKKSLELKKRYLLGEQANGNKIQKSGSTSVLDSRIRSFQSNISECQKLLNPSSDISPSMKTFLDRTKLGEKAANELMTSATNNIINDLKVEITIQKASSTASTDNEKENVFVNSKNELNKSLEYSDSRKSNSTTPTNNKNIIETIDLVTPEKKGTLDTSDSNKVIDLTDDSPVKSNKSIIEAAVKSDLSLDFKPCIPDILGHIEKREEGNKSKQCTPVVEKKLEDDEINLIDNNMEKVDVPEKLEAIYDNEIEDVQIEVPNIAWNSKSDNISLSSNSSCSSHSSSLEDIEHYILESTTSPETHNSGGNMASAGGNPQVPRLEIHDTTGTLMQIDSLMIIDGKYVGDPEDLKFMELPEGIIVPEVPAIKTSEVEDEHEVDIEPVTATPEPVDTTVIEAENVNLAGEIRVEVERAEEEPPPLPEVGPPLPEKGPPKTKPFNLKFDTKNENKIESLKNLPLIVDAATTDYKKAVKPITLNLSSVQKTPDTPTNPKGNFLSTPNSPLVDMDKTPTGEVMSRASDSETEPTGTAQILTETELSDWTADDCISENFVDMEFVHHSNKTNLKGGRRQKKSSSGSTKGLPTSNEVLQEVAKTAPVAEIEGILKCIDIDDIEFMDTGSDGSGTEPLSATNTALLRNRGYMEFVDNSSKPNTATAQSAILAATYKPIQTKRTEKLGIDYIEQGAYIMHDDINKTPVNEAVKSVSLTQMTQSLTDSSTINDVEDESTCVLSSQILLTSVDNNTLSKTTIQTATTEESDALTVVTSPFDSSSPHTQNSNNLNKGAISETVRDQEKDDNSTPSSSDRAPKTSQSTSCTNSAPSSSKNTPPCQIPKNPLLEASDNSFLRKSNDELSYEEYVRALQQKIVQISTTALGDSLEVRKQRRKSSKGEAPIALTNPNQTVIESTPTINTLASSNLSLFKDEETNTNIKVTSSPAANTTQARNINTPVATVLPTQLNKVPETPTLTSKLEEITKERTKQKDLIHDLVMDKLQSKKQLNAEKRLHRSRQRTLMTSGGGGCGLGGGGYSSGSSLSPTPKLAAANSTTDTNCTNRAHYHVSTAAAAETVSSSSNRAPVPILLNTNSTFKENKCSDSYISAYGLEALSPTRARAYKQRPFSEHLEGDLQKQFEQTFKINKTPSFSCTTTKQQQQQPLTQPTSYSELIGVESSAPLRQKRNGASVATTPTEINKDSNFSVSTENLRSEARARARLKSNSELGLSPEEKMQLLRKRLQVEYNSNTSTNPETIKSKQLSFERQFNNKKRDNKMNNSKSVNDLAYLSQLQNQNTNTASISDNRYKAKISDFTSDPNLLLSSSQTTVATNIGKPLKTKSGRRIKDPERRKSLIQSLSSFFYKGQQNKEYKHQKDATASTGDGNSAQPERPGTGGGGSSSTSTSHTISSGIDGVLSRFRISPKSKEKSRDKKEDYLLNMANYNGSSPTRRLRTSSASSARSHERQNNPDFPSRTQLAHTPYSHSHINNFNSNNKTNCRQRHYEQHKQQQSSTSANHNQHSSHTPNKKSSSSSALAFSSSSPQLCVNKSQSMTNTNVAAAAAYDDQMPPPIPPLPLNYQRSDDESYATETRDQKKQRAISKAVRQAELKRLRIAQEIQREQEEIEVQLKELETRGVLIEKALRGEEQHFENTDSTNNLGSSDEKLLKELLEIWRYITQLKKRDEELGIRQQELQLEHRHAQLKEELNLRLSCNKLDKSSADVAAEGAILNEMLEIVAKRAALRPSASNHDLAGTSELLTVGEKPAVSTSKLQLSSNRGQSNDNDESNI